MVASETNLATLKEKISNRTAIVGVVGLGYVGLPFAVEKARVGFWVLGVEQNPRRAELVNRGESYIADVPTEVLKEVVDKGLLRAETGFDRVAEMDVIVIAVPTPLTRNLTPDLQYVERVTREIAPRLRPGQLISLESTTYPGTTEEVMLPMLEQSGLKVEEDFFLVHSPERVNPGDPEHTLEKVVKVVAGQDPETTELLARVYSLVVKAGVYKAPDIRTAEAAKVIENVQRDLNIALMNELAMLFHRLGLDTHEVLKAAGTKWNFLPFEPGLVGGHCIPVDPYYLTHKAQEVGYHPELILAGRRVNDGMGVYVAREAVKLLIRAGRPVKGAKALVLGVTFKEEVPDVRNTRVKELALELKEHGVEVFGHDPVVGEEAVASLGLCPVPDPFALGRAFDAVVLAVPHRAFRGRPLQDYLGLLRGDGLPGIFVDVKGVFREAVPREGVFYWCL